MTFGASDTIVVFMTATGVEEASRMAEKLVDEELAACVQILPQVHSIYRWKDKVERQTEVFLIAKTLRSKFAELEREVRAVHSYEVPEVTAVAVSDISEPYLAWLIGAVEQSERINRPADHEVKNGGPQ